MRKPIFFIAFFLFLQGISSQEEKILQGLSAFNEVKAFDGLSVNLIKSDENKVVITGANINKVAVVNNSGVLKLRMEIDKIFSGYRTFIEVHYNQTLTVIDVNEDARITSEEKFVQDVLELKAQEGGELEISSETEQLLIKAVSGGDVIASGSADNQDIIINTGGTYEGERLKTKFTTVSVNAGGEANIYATDYVKANVKAGGKVFVYGNPKKMDEKTVFGGKIERVE